jgi:hypothetical protein
MNNEITPSPHHPLTHTPTYAFSSKHSEPGSEFLLRQGNIPLVITMVHATTLAQSRHGTLPDRNADERVKRYEIAMFHLLWKIVAGLERRCGRPYIVVPLIHRSRIDFNRGKVFHEHQRAYDDPAAERLYDRFDTIVGSFLEQAIPEGTRGLLIDLHGCTTEAADLFMGSLHGQTLSERNGVPFAYNTLRHTMVERGWRVAPPVGEPEIRYPSHPYGVINRHNLARKGQRGSSIQLEVSRYIRVDALLNARFGDDLALALAKVLSSEF